MITILIHIKMLKCNKTSQNAFGVELQDRNTGKNVKSDMKQRNFRKELVNGETW